MTCGIYKLTFPSGRTYIGKSINIEERWKQHFDKLSKGKAAKNMQAEYDSYGEPSGEVFFECHADHLDIMEETLIARLNPELNTTRCPDRLDGIYDDEFEYVVGWFSMSTVDHINTIAKYTLEKRELAEQLEAEVENTEWQEEFIKKLGVERSDEELAADITGRILGLSEQLEVVKTGFDNLSNEHARVVSERDSLLAYRNLPWYKKLFS